MRRTILPVLLAVWLTLGESSFLSVASAADPIENENAATSPLVIGFERFGRHAMGGEAVGSETETAAIASGRLLISELSCTACHNGDDLDLQAKNGPLLSGAGNRINPAWIARFLRDPQAAKPGTTMPHVLHAMPDSEKAAAIDALVAFISDLQQPFDEVKGSGAVAVPHEFWNMGTAESGEKLYHTIGCVACHQPDPQYEPAQFEVSSTDQLIDQLDPEDLEELGLAEAARPVPSIPLPSLAHKYHQESLTFFLLNPESVRPAGRMPSLKLTPVEAADLSAYLLSTPELNPDGLNDGAGDLIDSDSGNTTVRRELIGKGRTLFAELGCANCHVLPGVAKLPRGNPLSQLYVDSQTGCLSESVGTGPVYGLERVQKSAIRHALEALDSPTTNQSVVSHTLQQMNCLACHERDRHGGVGRFRKAYFETIGSIDLGDEGRLPPPLTGIGQKLKTKWFDNVLQGKGDVRPHMTIRMPIFPAAETAALPALLAEVDQQAHKASAAAAYSKVDILEMQEPAAAGRHLMDIGCVQCHAFRGESLPGVVGIDLDGVTTRIRPAWFLEFLSNPASVKARTRMPNFFPDGISQDQELLGGDPIRQIAAMWSYLDQVKTGLLPEKIELSRAQNFELVPDSRPIVFRTFMPAAGTHAIAVGFPEKIHFAFDAESMRLASGWKGRFIDAQGTWFIRSAPPAEPLGDSVIQFPPGVPFAKLSASHNAWPAESAETLGYQFKGYRLDPSGIPTFLYHIDNGSRGAIQVEDTIRPNASGGLRRSLRVRGGNPSGVDQTLYFRVAAGENLHVAGDSVRNSAGLATNVSGSEAILDQAGYLIPVSTNDMTITVTYQW